MKQKTCLINGKWSLAIGETLTSINPSTGKVVWKGPSASKEEIKRAVASAHQAFEDWSKFSVDERMEWLRAFAKILEKQKKEFATLISEEMGKPYWESLTEVAAMINKIEISYQAYQDRCREVSADMDVGRRYTRFRPHGVVAVLGPFNFPGHLPHGHIVPAILAGNTVVFKPSEYTPRVGEAMARIWQEAALPAGVINLVQGGPPTGEALLQHPGIQGIYFTGSVSTGHAIHRMMAEHPEKILAMEMGGNNPLIVDDVEDVKAAAYLTIQSAFITSGQRCSCARRLIVPKGEKGSRFLTELISLTQKIQVGPYTQRPEPFMGPVISSVMAQKILLTALNLHKKGGIFLSPLERFKKDSAFLRPGIMDVSDVNDRPDEEIFGPFLQVIRVRNFEAAIQEANRTAFGLSAGLLSDDPQRYQKFYQKVHAGVVTWNRPLTGASSAAPFGGVGKSGNARPSAYFAADYCSYPVASMEQEKAILPQQPTPGIALK
ncbi:MAG: succinylglutamate-semialdehyde dehydrogenase [Candidatus Omnitrophica bacterium]|nr:succinylglutamate-semialdehyde dehydrogenase [Candidatus Omnitrophota bacterium]